jgi:molybdopterin-guanine dinucleotide biosynthesis protein A
LQALGDACADAAVSQTGPLPGAYSRSALTTLQERLAQGELALHEALDQLETRVVELDAELVQNVNTERELERLRSKVSV